MLWSFKCPAVHSALFRWIFIVLPFLLEMLNPQLFECWTLWEALILWKGVYSESVIRMLNAVFASTGVVCALAAFDTHEGSVRLFLHFDDFADLKRGFASSTQLIEVYSFCFLIVYILFNIIYVYLCIYKYIFVYRNICWPSYRVKIMISRLSTCQTLWPRQSGALHRFCGCSGLENWRSPDSQKRSWSPCCPFMSISLSES